MKKTLLAFIGLTALFLTSCGDSHLNEATALTGCEKNFFVGTAADEMNNYFIALRIDTVIDDITPFNPDAAMIEGNKTIKICFSHQNINSDNKTELDFMNTYVYDTKTKKEYKPSLRDNESEFNSNSGKCFFTIDVPKATKVTDLAVGANFGGEKNYADFIPLKSKGSAPKSDEVVSMNKEVTYETILRGSGKVKVNLKAITYNVSDKDKIAKGIRSLNPLAKIVKVDLEYTLEGDEADMNNISYLFTEYRFQFVQESSADLGFSISGNGTTKTVSQYFMLYGDEKIVSLSDSDSSPSLVFEIGK